jgi:hypothetical protein
MTDARQLALIDDDEIGKRSRGWMLLFKSAERAQPVCVLGTLDYCYEELSSLRAKFPRFLFASMYRPDGQLHRGFKP